MPDDSNINRSYETAVFGGGCFWCTEAIFKSLKGVISVAPGYAGGNTDNPTYGKVSRGDTGHAEVVKIEFDPNTITYDDLLNVFFHTHDPTTRDRQGDDVGEQYRSVIFYTNEGQRNKAEELLQELENGAAYDGPIVTKVTELDKFYEAEDSHKDYYEKNKNAPYCQFIITPKLAKLNERFEKLLK